jgi:hypothetical protein
MSLPFRELKRIHFRRFKNYDCETANCRAVQFSFSFRGSSIRNNSMTQHQIIPTFDRDPKGEVQNHSICHRREVPKWLTIINPIMNRDSDHGSSFAEVNKSWQWTFCSPFLPAGIVSTTKSGHILSSFTRCCRPFSRDHRNFVSSYSFFNHKRISNTVTLSHEFTSLWIDHNTTSVLSILTFRFMHSTIATFQIMLVGVLVLIALVTHKCFSTSRRAPHLITLFRTMSVLGGETLKSLMNGRGTNRMHIAVKLWLCKCRDQKAFVWLRIRHTTLSLWPWTWTVVKG